jgi:adenine deaminase
VLLGVEGLIMTEKNRGLAAEVIFSVVAAASGNKQGDLLLKNARLVNLLTRTVTTTNLLIKGSYIAAIGSSYDNAKKVIDLDGGYVVPGLIDAHLHLESTLLFPPALAEVVTPHGTTTVVNDPHEIANVLGMGGVKMMLDAAEGLPCDFFSTAPSCVPATDMETAGGEITLEDIKELLKHPRVIGLGEMMNYPGVLDADPTVLGKIAVALQAGKPVDGHAPGLSGKSLQTYLAAGISTDHECITAAEALEKLKYGMKIIIRHGSASSSLAELFPLVTDTNVSYFMFGSDDRDAGELLEKGHLDDLLKTAVSLGADPFLMLRVATMSAAQHYRLYDRGLLAPGYRADLVVFNNLTEFKAELVIKDGRVVARQGRLLQDFKKHEPPAAALQTVNLHRPLSADDFSIAASSAELPVIGILPGQLITEKLMMQVKADSSGNVAAKPEDDFNKIAIVERHKNSGRIAVALVKGMGLKEGALASSVAHDSHNIIVVGVEEKAMAAAVNEIGRLRGGFVAVDGSGAVKAALPLAIGGLMSLKPATEVAGEMNKLLQTAADLGSRLPQPFLTMSFLALPVIPSLKITDRGLFDVDNFSFI